jgi:hypothetical protein
MVYHPNPNISWSEMRKKFGEANGIKNKFNSFYKWVNSRRHKGEWEHTTEVAETKSLLVSISHKEYLLYSLSSLCTISCSLLALDSIFKPVLFLSVYFASVYAYDVCCPAGIKVLEISSQGHFNIVVDLCCVDSHPQVSFCGNNGTDRWVRQRYRQYHSSIR